MPERPEIHDDWPWMAPYGETTMDLGDLLEQMEVLT
jgi:hypothetical protein